jgi:hypothetical protein
MRRPYRLNEYPWMEGLRIGEASSRIISSERNSWKERRAMAEPRMEAEEGSADQGTSSNGKLNSFEEVKVADISK